MEVQAKSARLHPLIAIAAISVTLASLAAVAVLTGVMPGTHAETAPAAQLASTEPAAQPAPAAPAPAAQPATAPEPAAVPPAAPAKPAASEGRIVHRTSTRHVATESHAAPMPPVAAAEPPAAPPAPVCADCGTIESVRPVVVEGQGTGLGAVAGGVLGGVLGHQVGHGRGNDAATVLGAVGGAFAGHQIEKSQRKSTHYEITVRMTDGSYRTVTTKEQPAWQPGDRVRVENGTLISANQTY